MQIWLDKTVAFVKQSLSDAEAGHDWHHIERVWKLTLRLLQSEPGDSLTCQLAALLHDIADSKFHGGNHEIGPAIATGFLLEIGVDKPRAEAVGAIILNLSYSQSLSGTKFRTDEWALVQDADRLDALGAIGIARTFHYGGFRNRALYDPENPPLSKLDQQTYQNTKGPTINHFYEKLLLLKDLMNTTTGRTLALQRHHFIEQFLTQFYAELDTTR